MPATIAATFFKILFLSLLALKLVLVKMNYSVKGNRIELNNQKVVSVINHFSGLC